MIIKRARGQESGVSSFTDLARYIANETETADVLLRSEKLPDIESAAKIMQATAAATKSKYPLYHLIDAGLQEAPHESGEGFLAQDSAPIEIVSSRLVAIGDACCRSPGQTARTSTWF